MQLNVYRLVNILNIVLDSYTLGRRFTQAEIGQQTGLSTRTVSNILQRFGFHHTVMADHKKIVAYMYQDYVPCFSNIELLRLGICS